MKKFYQNLTLGKKILLHFNIILVLLIIIPLLSTKIPFGIGVILWIVCFIFEIFFIAWSFSRNKKYVVPQKKMTEDKVDTDVTFINTNKIVDSTSRTDSLNDKVFPHEQKSEENYTKGENDFRNTFLGAKPIIESENSTKKIIKTESNFDLDKIILDYDLDYKIKYEYKENLCFCENFNAFGLGDEVEFNREKDNEFDKDAVFVSCGGLKIGYLFKGTCRDIVLNCLDHEKYIFHAFIYKYDIENKKIGLKIGFYTQFKENEIIIGTIGKTSKIDPSTNEKRQEQVECLSENDKVTLRKKIDDDELLVSTDSGYELGVLSKSISTRIIETIDDLDNVEAYISSVELVDGKIKAKVKVFII